MQTDNSNVWWDLIDVSNSRITALRCVIFAQKTKTISMDEVKDLQKIVNEIVERERYKYNKEVVLRILTALAEGQGRIQACKLAGISYETFTVWMDKKSDFSDAVKRAEKIGAGVTKDICQRRIIEDKSWQSAAWWLERKHPEEYAQSNNLNINIEKPAIIVGSEKAKDILDKLAEE